MIHKLSKRGAVQLRRSEEPTEITPKAQRQLLKGNKRTWEFIERTAGLPQLSSGTD